MQPLHTQAPLARFSDRATDYAKHRPTYPPEAMTTILADLNAEPIVIADVGAGTGISSRLLADRGTTVFAIEPNAAMREAAVPHPQVEFRDATAENTQLPDRAVDLVTCCQAFHWFEPIATLQEFHRILKPGGRVALMWNDRNTDDPLTAEYTEIVRTASDQGFFDRRDRKSADALAHSPLFTNFRAYQFAHPYHLDLNCLIGLVLSASYIPKAGDAYERLMTDLSTFYQKWVAHDETIALSFKTNVYLAEHQP